MLWFMLAITAVLVGITIHDVREHDYQPGDWMWLVPAIAIKPGLFIAVGWALYFWARP